MTVKSLNQIIGVNDNFKTSINLYLSLNKTDKVLSYIPTKSTAALMKDYLEAVVSNREHASLLVGPYGKGKSHLLLVMLAILSMERNLENTATIKTIARNIEPIGDIGVETSQLLMKVWNKKNRFLPVILNNSRGNLNQDFLIALNDALKRNNLSDLVPDTYYSIALDGIKKWEENYPVTYRDFKLELENYGFSEKQMIAALKSYSKDALDIFKEIYPKITAGSEFSPLVSSDVLPLYKSVSEKLVEEYSYSGIYIVFDEFSKYIESQDGMSSGHDMKLLQDICELASDSSNAQVYITMVAHKSIKEYGKYLSRDLINSFTGIEGRIVEKYFVTSSKNNYELIKHAIIKDKQKLGQIPAYETYLGDAAVDKYYQLPVFKSRFERADFAETVLRGCYPLSPTSTYLLLNVSEKVAQNERTLFTFISNNEPNSMARFIAEHTDENEWVIGASLIYDYFSGLFKKDVSNEMIHNIWLSAEYALSKCSTKDQKKIVKALAIVSVVNKEDELPATDKYLQLVANADDYDTSINGLSNLGLIYKKKSTDTYVFKTKAGSTLKTEIRKQRDIKGDNVNYSKALIEISETYYVIPRRYNAKHTITRYFRHEYLDVDTFMKVNDSNVYFDKADHSDGKVLTLYSFNHIDREAVITHITNLGCNNLIVVVPSIPLKVQNALRDYEIICDLKKRQFFTDDNEIMAREVPLIENDISAEVLKAIDDIYLDDSCKAFICNGKELKEYKYHEIELIVNETCEKLYAKAIHINNEIINRSVISTSQTKKARLNIISAILDGADDESFYLGTNQEATIYRALLVNTGVKSNNAEDSIKEILKIMNDFVDSCCDSRRAVSDLIGVLTGTPYGMRAGVIPVFWAYILSKRNEDFVIYKDDTEVILDAETVVNMCENMGVYSMFVSKEDLLKERYIYNLQKLFNVDESRNLSDNRIKNILICMQRWFRSLPQATRNLALLDYIIDDEEVRSKMKSIKKLLQKAEVNPYEAVFVKLPNAFDETSYDKLTISIEKLHETFENYFLEIQKTAIAIAYSVFNISEDSDLYHALSHWYEKQSNTSKQGLHSSKITNAMSYISHLNCYDDISIIEGLVKVICDTYIDNWTESSSEEFNAELASFKSEVESINDSVNDGQNKLSFVSKEGELVERYYNCVNEDTGSILRNIIEDTLEEFDDLSVNDRVAILLEMIEKVIG